VLFRSGTGPDGQDNKPGLSADDLQPIPITTLPLAEDGLLAPWSACTGYHNLQDADKQTQPWQGHYAEHEALLTKLSASLGVNITKTTDMWTVYDPLKAEMSHGLPWPANISMADFLVLEEIMQWQTNRTFLTQEMRLLSSGVFLDTLSSRLAAAATKDVQPGWNPNSFQSYLTTPGSRYKQGPLLWIYSAHDTTVAAILAGLGLFSGVNPPYGSTLVFEMLNDTATSKLSVRLFYNNGTTPDILFANSSLVTLPGCTALCPLDQFQSYLGPRRLTADKYQVACFGEPPVKSAASPVMVAIVGTVLGLVLGGVIGVTVTRSWTSRNNRHGADHERTSLVNHGEHVEVEVSAGSAPVV